MHMSLYRITNRPAHLFEGGKVEKEIFFMKKEVPPRLVCYMLEILLSKFTMFCTCGFYKCNDGLGYNNCLPIHQVTIPDRIGFCK